VSAGGGLDEGNGIAGATREGRRGKCTGTGHGQGDQKKKELHQSRRANMVRKVSPAKEGGREG